VRAISRAIPALLALRPGQWAHFVVLPAAGGAGGARLALGAVAAAAALAFAYGVNAVADRATDRSRAKNPLAGVAAPGREVAVTLAACAAAAAAAGAALGPASLLWVAASLACGLAYSVGPRLKAVPVAGVVCNTGIFVPLLAVALPARPPEGTVVLIAAFVALIVQNQLLHELADAGEDADAGDRTTARVLGPTAARAVVAALPLVLVPLSLPAAAVAAGAVAGVAVSGAAAARRAHRWVALVAGALLWLGTLAGQP
jgi:4-hydroxybenzoate polyprenyltransferase